MTFRLAVVADIHHGPETQTKRGSAALPLAAEVVARAGEAGVGAVLDLGDRISDVSAAEDRRRAREVAAIFARLAAPAYHLHGNHDLDHLSAAENDAILGQIPGHRIVPAGAWDLVLWRPDPRLTRNGQRGLALDAEDLDWLAEVCRVATRPMLVATHTPVSPMALAGNYYFERAPHLGVYPEAPRVREVLAQAEVPVVCLSGHVHWNSVAQDDGIAYLTQQSLTESFTTSGEPAGAWGLLELGEEVRWTVHGRDPMAVSLSPSPRRWSTPLGRAAIAEVAS